MNWDKIQDKFVKLFTIFTINKFKELLKKIKDLFKKSKKEETKAKEEGDKASSSNSSDIFRTIDEELDKIAEEQDKMMYIILFNISKKVLKNKVVINRILKTKWTDKHFSDRIWNDKKKLKKILKSEIHKAVKSEKSRDELIDLISKRCDVSVYQAKRLVDTEISNVINQSVIEQGKLLRKKRYKIVVTMDERTSEICQKLHRANKTYDINERKVPGKNWVPAHPHCRSRIQLI